MRESTIEAYLVKRVKALGGEVRKVQWVGRRGAPDRLVMFPQLVMLITRQIVDHRGRTTVWVELKAPGEKPRPEQLREHARMRRMERTSAQSV